MLSEDLQGRAKLPIILYVDVFPFRVENEQNRYLIFERRPDVVMPSVWQPVCGKIGAGASIRESFTHQVRKKTGLNPSEVLPIDHLNSYYDHYYDCVMMVPCAAALLPQGEISLDLELHSQCRWVTYDEIPDYIGFNGQLRAYQALNTSLTKSAGGRREKC